MEQRILWRVTCHNHYDYKLTNRSDEPVFNVKVTSPSDGVIPFGESVESRMNAGRSLRFRLVNTPKFDTGKVEVVWTDEAGARHAVHLNALVSPSNAARLEEA